MNSGKEPFDGDDLVTETYRELGVEKAPERLNQDVLRMASGGGLRSPTRNILFGAWMKPVAWAATIGLSLAIVLELSEVPTAPVQSDPVRSDSMPTAESMREEALEETQVINAVEVFSREPKGKLDAVAAPSQPPIAAKTEAMVSDLFLLEQSDIADSCDAAVRLSRESWLECIEELRQSGSEEAADREYEAFILDYSVESGDLEENK